MKRLKHGTRVRVKSIDKILATLAEGHQLHYELEEQPLAKDIVLIAIRNKSWTAERAQSAGISYHGAVIESEDGGLTILNAIEICSTTATINETDRDPYVTDTFWYRLSADEEGGWVHESYLEDAHTVTSTFVKTLMKHGK